jgi:spoIIIJ-associated protein
MGENEFQREEVAARIQSLLAELLPLANLQLTVEIQNTSGMYDRDFENPDLVVTFDGKDAESLLANKAELLKALEHFVLEAVRLPREQHERVFFDCRDYRMMRVDELHVAAKTAAERVEKTGVPFSFGPMNSRERRVIHMALRNVAGVRTESLGEGQFRKVTVHPTETSPKPGGRSHSRAPSR